MNVMMLLDKQSGSVLQTINQGIKDIFGLDDKARERANQSLRLFIENLVAQDFLPEVYVSFRSASAELLTLCTLLSVQQMPGLAISCRITYRHVCFRKLCQKLCKSCAIDDSTTITLTVLWTSQECLHTQADRPYADQKQNAPLRLSVCGLVHEVVTDCEPEWRMAWLQRAALCCFKCVMSMQGSVYANAGGS